MSAAPTGTVRTLAFLPGGDKESPYPYLAPCLVVLEEGKWLAAVKRLIGAEWIQAFAPSDTHAVDLLVNEEPGPDVYAGWIFDQNVVMGGAIMAGADREEGTWRPPTPEEAIAIVRHPDDDSPAEELEERDRNIRAWIADGVPWREVFQ